MRFVLGEFASPHSVTGGTVTLFISLHDDDNAVSE